MTNSYSPEPRTIASILDLIVWRCIGQPLFSLVPLPFFALRVIVLRAFGAKIGKSNRIYPSVKIWLPKMLIIGSFNGIGEGVYLYNKASIVIGDGCVISRGSFLCTASHDCTSETFDLYSRSIWLEDNVWVAATSIVLPGIRLCLGSVIGAGSVVTKSTLPWHIYGGNPARIIKTRILSQTQSNI